MTTISSYLLYDQKSRRKEISWWMKGFIGAGRNLRLPLINACDPVSVGEWQGMSIVDMGLMQWILELVFCVLQCNFAFCELH